jgi:hypothetical protein
VIYPHLVRVLVSVDLQVGEERALLCWTLVLLRSSPMASRKARKKRPRSSDDEGSRSDGSQSHSDAVRSRRKGSHGASVPGKGLSRKAGGRR